MRINPVRTLAKLTAIVENPNVPPMMADRCCCREAGGTWSAGVADVRTVRRERRSSAASRTPVAEHHARLG